MLSRKEELEKWCKETETDLVKYHGKYVLRNTERGINTRFFDQLNYRINKKLSTNIVVTGEAGIGKSTLSIDLAQTLDDNFSIDQVVFGYSGFMDLVLNLPMGKPLIFDEPSYSVSHRTFYKELQRSLVQTMESMRFRVHPVIIPIINASLLDKTIRRHLVTFQIVVKDRGVGKVYRVKPSQFTDDVYYNFVCNLNSLHRLERCQRDSCLDCPKLTAKNSELFVCNELRAQYERKKDRIQTERYKVAQDKAETTETKQLTNRQIEKLAVAICTQFIEKGKVNVNKMCVALDDEYGIKLHTSCSRSPCPFR